MLKNHVFQTFETAILHVFEIFDIYNITRFRDFYKRLENFCHKYFLRRILRTEKRQPEKRSYRTIFSLFYFQKSNAVAAEFIVENAFGDEKRFGRRRRVRSRKADIVGRKPVADYP